MSVQTASEQLFVLCRICWYHEWIQLFCFITFLLEPSINLTAKITPFSKLNSSPTKRRVLWKILPVRLKKRFLRGAAWFCVRFFLEVCAGKWHVGSCSSVVETVSGPFSEDWGPLGDFYRPRDKGEVQVALLGPKLAPRLKYSSGFPCGGMPILSIKVCEILSVWLQSRNKAVLTPKVREITTETLEQYWGIYLSFLFFSRMEVLV